MPLNQFGVNYGNAAQTKSLIAVILNQVSDVETQLNLAAGNFAGLNFASVDTDVALREIPILRERLNTLKRNLATLVADAQQWEGSFAAKWDALALGLDIHMTPTGPAFNGSFADLIDHLQEREDFGELSAFGFFGTWALASLSIGLDKFGQLVADIIERGASVGRSLSTRLQARNVLGRLGRYPTSAHRGLAAGLRKIPSSAWPAIGRGVRTTGWVMTGIQAAITFSEYHAEHQNVGRAISYTGFVDGIPVVLGIGGAAVLGVLGAPAWGIVIGAGAVVAVSSLGARRLYNSSETVRNIVHFVGDNIITPVVDFIVRPEDERPLRNACPDAIAQWSSGR